MSKDYVSLAVSILAKSEQEGDPGLRLWAVDLLNANSPVKFDAETSKKLTEGELTLPILPSASFQPVAALPEDDPRRSLSRSIGKLIVSEAGREVASCTAWLVAVDQVLTADYCIAAASGPLTLYLENATSSRKAYPVERSPLESNHDLGFALLRVEGNPGKENGYLPLSATGPSLDEPLFIAHYAMGASQSFSKPCKVIGVSADGAEFQHDCETTGGVGGAPLVRLSDHTVFGLHYAAGVGDQPRRAKRIDAILAKSAAMRKPGAPVTERPASGVRVADPNDGRRQ